MLCLAVWFLRYTRHSFGPSSYSLRIAVGHRALPNARQITLQKKEQNIRFSELSELWRICVVADFPLDFPVVFTISIIMIRFRYIIESCQSFQTMLFSGLRNISLQVLRDVGQAWNEGSRMLRQRLPSPSTTARRLVLQNLPSLGLPALIRPSPSELLVLEFRARFPRPHTYTPRSNSSIICTLEYYCKIYSFPSH